MAEYQYTYVIKDLNKYYGQKHVLKNIHLSFLPGAKIGMIGANGAGKSTLMKIMAGIDKDFTGEAWAAEGVKVGYLPQEPRLDESKNVFDNIMEGLKEKKQLLERFEAISMKFAEEISDDEMQEVLQEQGELQEQIDHLGAWEIDREVEVAMDALNAPAKDADVSKLSGGEKRRVALCRLLLEKPDMLLLDEPTNHLDADSVAWLENYLLNYSGTVVLITHDRYFLDNVTKWILEMDRGQGIPWQGNYTSWLEQKEKRLATEAKADRRLQQELSRELDWAKQSPKARQAKSKARLKNIDQLKDRERLVSGGTAQIVIPLPERLGNKVVELNQVTVGFGDRNLIKDLSLKVDPGSVIGVIGPNGAGKTTLTKVITGQVTPTGGDVVTGDTVRLAYVDQSRDQLDGDQQVWSEISDGLEEINLGTTTVKARAYASAFNFKGPDQQKLVSQLSGGERNRVHLAKMLKTGGNFIILDEPTNDLDVDTLRALEEAIHDFDGCVIIISHDRWFLDRVSTHTMAFEGGGVVEYYDGPYSAYTEYRKTKYGDEPTVKRFKKLAG
ncbi:MAG: energy-dependent translational throttle protein EttA [Pseudomonadota bacterium]